MFERDLLVALIAFALGFAMISSAVLNYERAFEMRTPNYLSQTMGRNAARMVIGLIGALVVLMSIYIISAPIFYKSPKKDELGRFDPASRQPDGTPVLAESQ